MLKNTKDLTIGIIGGGTVGRATARCYQEHVKEVRVYDCLQARATHQFFEVVPCSDIIFICLPGSEVDPFFSAMSGAGDYDPMTINWVLKSTVPIGTTRALSDKYKLNNIVHSPEFLTERCAMTDIQMPAMNVIGRIQRGTMWVERSVCGVQLQMLYGSRFPGISVFDMTSEESEALKLFLNGFFAVKVAYFNEICTLAESLDLDWGLIRAGMLADGRIAQSHTQVPGPDGEFGFGGKCLPKDLQTLIDCLEGGRTVFGESSPAEICKAALRRNQTIDRRKES